MLKRKNKTPTRQPSEPLSIRVGQDLDLMIDKLTHYEAQLLAHIELIEQELVERKKRLVETKNALKLLRPAREGLNEMTYDPEDDPDAPGHLTVFDREEFIKDQMRRQNNGEPQP